jgi:hypothetical protein
MLSFAALSAQIIGQSGSVSSTGERRNEIREIVFRSLEFGYSPAFISPRGDNTFSGIRYDAQPRMFSALLREDDTELYVDFLQPTIDGRSTRFITTGAKFDGNVLPQNGNTLGFRPLITVLLLADLIFASTLSDTATLTNNLTLSSFNFGGGFGARYRTMKSLAVLKVDAFIGFGTQAFSAVTGGNRGFFIDFGYQYPNLWGNFGLAVSYRYRYTVTDYSESENNRYDYMFRIHNITAGLTF